jgi:lambda repressor-like predicted transcriptional regulator
MSGTRIERLLADLQAAARAKKLSKREIARRAGLHPNTLSNFKGWKSKAADHRPWSPSPAVIAALERILLDDSLKPAAKRKRQPQVTT